MIFHPDSLTRRSVYHLMCQTIIPRPIAWVITSNGDTPESWNLAPFSFFNGVGTDPPLLGFSIGHDLDQVVPANEEVRRKDTLVNLRREGRCVVNIPRASAYEHVTASARPLDHGVSEPLRFGIGLQRVPGWDLPRVASTPIAFLGRVHGEIEISPGERQLLLLVRLEQVWVDDIAVTSDATDRIVIDPALVDPLCRLGAGNYGSLGDVIK